MPQSDKPSKQALTSSDRHHDEDNVIVTVDNKSDSQDKNATLSTQMQLVGLAKQFVLDGAFVAEDKQMPLAERVQKRELVIALRKQKNLESIIKKTIKYCSKHDATDRTDPDWFSHFTSLAEDISNTTMQDLWAKILAGEISRQGSFSLKSLTIFRSLSVNDAKLFAKAVSLCVKDNHRKNPRIITGVYQPPGLFNLLSKTRIIKVNLSHFGLSYSELLTLAENHLLFSQEAETNPILKGEQISFQMHGQPLILTAVKNDSVLSFLKFTPAGAELANLIADNPNESYFAELNQTINHNFNIQ